MSDIGHFPCNEVFETNLQIRWLNPSIPPGFRCNPAWATHTVDWKWVTAWVPKEVSILAGHSKWAQIKRKKAINDKQRGRVISKHIRAIQAAVREGGSGDSSVNLSLKNALAAAKSDDVSADSVERAIERGLGSSEGNASAYETATYEGYGPHGVAILIEALTDNRNRTAAEVRHVFNKHGGDMSGNTAWQFETKGIIVLSDADETVQELAISTGAQTTSSWRAQPSPSTLSRRICTKLQRPCRLQAMNWSLANSPKSHRLRSLSWLRMQLILHRCSKALRISKMSRMSTPP